MADAASRQTSRRAYIWWALFALGLVVRLLVLIAVVDLPTTIMDEQHYARIATSVMAGDGFAWGPGSPTSIRPPLYPGTLAALWTVFGAGNLQVVRALQIVLAGLTAVLLYWLGTRAFDERVGRFAAAAFWLYPSFIFFNVLILTETLFTFLLVAFVLLAVMLVQNPRPANALGCGVVLGLGALTRSVLWPVPAVFCPLLVLLLPRTRERFALAALVFLGYALVVAPWAVRNTRLQGVVTIVDTMGGLNLRMGNYEHTPDDRMWDAVALEGTQNWASALKQEYPGRTFTEGEKDKWAQKKAFEYMLTHPGITLRRSVIKFADFWGLEREFIAGVQKGMFSPPLWFTVIASLCILASLPIVAIAAAAGAWLTIPSDRRVHVLLLLPVMAIAGVHVLAFGHSRYHLPLIPVMAVYASALIVHGIPAGRLGARFTGAAVTVLVLCGVWAHQILVTDSTRIRAVIERAGF